VSIYLLVIDIDFTFIFEGSSGFLGVATVLLFTILEVYAPRCSERLLILEVDRLSISKPIYALFTPNLMVSFGNF
jgi:hypothetical protein